MNATVASSSVTEPEAVLLVEVRAMRLLMFLMCRRLAIALPICKSRERGWGGASGPYEMSCPERGHSQDALGSTWRVDDAGGLRLAPAPASVGIFKLADIFEAWLLSLYLCTELCKLQ